MDRQLGGVTFQLPDDWRDDTTYQFVTADGTGTLVVEVAAEPSDSKAILQNALAQYTGVWGPLIIYTNPIVLRRGHGASISAAEGEQRPMDGSGRLRFALVGLSAARWSAKLAFLSPPRSDFVDRVRHIVASARFETETWTPPPRVPHFCSVRAGPLELSIPADWRAPDTLEFRYPANDGVSLVVTTRAPAVPAATIQWADVISEPFHIAYEDTLSPPIPLAGEWETEWLVEIGSAKLQWIVRKAMKTVGSNTITALLQGPETLLRPLESAWAQYQRSLRARP